MKTRLRAAALLSLLWMSSLPGWARFQQPSPCKNSFSIDQETAEGAKAKAQVYKTMPVLPDSSPVSQYVQKLGLKLASYAPGRKWPFEFHVVQSSDINAFALPGGPIFVNLGTLQAANTEAQLAGVMAHEISHVVMRHATCNETKQRGQSLWWGLAQLGAGVLAPGAAGVIAQQGVGALAGLSFLRMSREDEKQSDLMGTDILYDAGYDPRGLPQFFETIQAKYGSGGAQILSDHPNPGNRTEYVNQEIASLPPRTDYVKMSNAFRSMKKEADAIKGYSAKEIASGVWRKTAPTPAGPAGQIDFKPSSSYQSLNGTGFSISYPSNWQVQQGQGSGATIEPVGGSVNGGLAYGAVIDSFVPPTGSDLGAATYQLISSLTEQNQGLKPVSGTENVLVNQVSGKSVELESPSSPVGGAEHDWLVALRRPDNSLSYIVFVAPAKDFQVLRPTFEQMLRTFRLQ